MLKNVINRKDIVMIFLLAIYNFCFLGTEFFFDDMMSQVILSRSYVLTSYPKFVFKVISPRR